MDPKVTIAREFGFSQAPVALWSPVRPPWFDKVPGVSPGPRRSHVFCFDLLPVCDEEIPSRSLCGGVMNVWSVDKVQFATAKPGDRWYWSWMRDCLACAQRLDAYVREGRLYTLRDYR